MSIDLTGAAVALIGIIGTLGASVLAQRAASRDRQIEATDQRKDRAEERREVTHAAANAEKRVVYADLNAAVRDYRTIGHDYLVDKIRGAEPNDFKQIEKAHARYRELYAHAQMVVPESRVEGGTCRQPMSRL